jgi:hypothetical protein
MSFRFTNTKNTKTKYYLYLSIPHDS